VAGRNSEKFQMAISPKRIIRSSSCLVLGWGVWEWRIISGRIKSKMARHHHNLINFNWTHILKSTTNAGFL